MPIPWSQDTLPNPTEPLTANQASLWVTMLRRLQRLVGGRFLADPGIIFLLSFDDGYVEQKHALTAEIEHPAPIVTGRVNKAVRIEKATANLLPNPSFEVGADDWEVPDSAVAILRDTSYHFNGDNTVSVASLRVSGQDLPSSPYTYSTFDVTANQAYSASAWLYSPGVAVSVMLELTFTGGTPVSDDSGLVEIPPNMWTRVTVDELFSGNNTDGEVRLWLEQSAPLYATGSRVSSWVPGGTALATSTSLALNVGDVLAASVVDHPPASGAYQFFMVTTGGTGPASATLRLNDGPTLDMVWLDCVQVEKRTFASSYADYLQGTGYSGAERTLSMSRMKRNGACLGHGEF